MRSPTGPGSGRRAGARPTPNVPTATTTAPLARTLMQNAALHIYTPTPATATTRARPSPTGSSASAARTRPSATATPAARTSSRRERQLGTDRHHQLHGPHARRDRQPGGRAPEELRRRHPRRRRRRLGHRNGRAPAAPRPVDGAGAQLGDFAAPSLTLKPQKAQARHAFRVKYTVVDNSKVSAETLVIKKGRGSSPVAARDRVRRRRRHSYTIRVKGAPQGHLHDAAVSRDKAGNTYPRLPPGSASVSRPRRPTRCRRPGGGGRNRAVGGGRVAKRGEERAPRAIRCVQAIGWSPPMREGTGPIGALAHPSKTCTCGRGLARNANNSSVRRCRCGRPASRDARRPRRPRSPSAPRMTWKRAPRSRPKNGQCVSALAAGWTPTNPPLPST